MRIPHLVLACCSFLGVMLTAQANGVTTIQLNVYAQGNLPDKGFLILQATGDGKPQLRVTDQKGRGDIAFFVKSNTTPDYQATLPVDDPKTFNMTFMQIENADATDVVECRRYRWLAGYIDDYVANPKHKDITTLEINAYVDTVYVPGRSQDPADPHIYYENSTCTVKFKINDVDYPGK